MSAARQAYGYGPGGAGYGTEQPLQVLLSDDVIRARRDVREARAELKAAPNRRQQYDAAVKLQILERHWRVKRDESIRLVG